MNKTHKPLLTLVLVHNDLDGGGSAICIINHIKQKYGINAEYKLHFATYKNIDLYVERILDEPERYEKVFIADIHIHPELAQELYNVYKDNFILLDHHPSASNLKDIPNCIIDLTGKICGAAMCYKYLLKDQGFEFKHLSKLVSICNDYDLWLHNLPNNISKNLNFIFYHYWGEKFVERFQMGFDGFNAEELEVIKQKWLDVETQIKTVKFVDPLEEDVNYKNKLCIIPVSNNKDGEVNELCEYAIKTLNYEIVMFVNSRSRKISIRSSDNAAKKGLHIGNFNAENAWGGGHAQAGGISYFDELQLETICNAYSDKLAELNI